ncbi:MAG: GIY-YIG nuclease family protein [Oscillospiraceae bacterium]|nr:GIY-YIG nuclease family protein [Oscillospiraceae bacterium]
MFWVYTLWCEDGSLYTGFTDDIKRRIHIHYHQLKAAAKYTKSHKVTGIAALWKTESETAARKLEFRIKRLERSKKLLLIEKPERAAEFFPELSEFAIIPDPETKFEDCI